jgi:DNA polymerase-3 subunit alpha
MSLRINLQEDYSFREKATFELESLGFYVLYHPMIAFQETIEKLKLKPLSYLEKNQSTEVLAFIVSQKVIKTKQGKEMAFIELDDGTSQLEATLFTETYLTYKNELNNDIKIFKIKANEYRNQRTFVVESMKKV